jgi:hypothetical protein
MGKQSFTVNMPILSKTIHGKKTVELKLLLDSGAGGLFLNHSYAKRNKLILYPLNTPILPRNADGTPNSAGKITHYTWIKIQFPDRNQILKVFITDIGSSDIILGLPWFQKYNPHINWKTGKIILEKEDIDQHIDNILDRKIDIKGKPTTTINRLETEETITTQLLKTIKPSDSPNWRLRKQEQEIPEDLIIEDTDEPTNNAEITLVQLEDQTYQPLEQIWINAKTNVAMELAVHENLKKTEKTLDEMIPLELTDYKDIFDKEKANRFPESRPWDHAIDLKEDFIPKDCKNYPMASQEQEALDNFIMENLEKGYI